MFCVQILIYEMGFLVCVAIGVLYIVLMPIVGFLLACCRCCGNCGGKMYQKQTSSTHCLRRTLYLSMFAITIIILWVSLHVCVLVVLTGKMMRLFKLDCSIAFMPLHWFKCVNVCIKKNVTFTWTVWVIFRHFYSAGNICMFRSNEALNTSVEKGPQELNHTISNIHTFLTAVPQARQTIIIKKSFTSSALLICFHPIYMWD